MLKRKVIVCDVCDKEITYEKHYKFNRYSFQPYEVVAYWKRVA